MTCESDDCADDNDDDAWDDAEQHLRWKLIWGRVRPEDMSGNMCHAGGVTMLACDWLSFVYTGLWLADAH